MADRYWVGGTGTWDTTSTTNWSATSGGAPGASVPTANSDNVFFDQGGTYTVTMTGALECLGFTVSNGTVTFATGTTPTLNIRGSMSLVAGTVWDSTGTITFYAAAVTRTITTNGVTINANVEITAFSVGAWTLGSALTLGAAYGITLTTGVLNLGSFTLTTGFFGSSGTLSRTINFGTGNITLIGAGGTLWNTTTTSSLTMTGTRTVNVSYSGATAVTLLTGGENALSAADFNLTTGTYSVSISTGIGSLNLTGFSGTLTNQNRRLFGSLNLGTTATLASGSLTTDFVATTTGNTITTNGMTLNSPVQFNGTGGSWTLQDAMTVSALQTTYLTKGTLNLNNFTLTTGYFASANSNTRTIAFGTGNITVNGAGGTLFDTSNTNNLATTGTQVVNVSYSGAVATTISPGVVNEIDSTSFNFTTGTYTLTMSAGRWRNLDFTGFAGTVPNASAQTIYGNLNLGTTTITANSSIWTFAATSAGKTITTNGRTMDFPLTFGGAAAGGSWILQDAITTGPTRTTTLSRGTLDLNNFTLTTGRFNGSGANARVIAFGTGNITLNGSGISTIWDTSTSTNYSVTGTPTVNVACPNSATPTIETANTPQQFAFNLNIVSGTYALQGRGTVRVNNINCTGFTGTLSLELQVSGNYILNPGMATSTALTTFLYSNVGNTITTNGVILNGDVRFDGPGASWILQDAFTMLSSRALTHANGTLDLNAKTLTVGLRYATVAGTKDLTFNGGTLVCPVSSVSSFNNVAPTGFTTTAGTGTGTISMTAAATKTFVGGGSTFNCTLNQGGIGALTITGSNTFNNITNTVQPASVLFTAGTTNTFNNFNLNGTPGNRITLASATAAAHTLSKESGAVDVDYLSITNSAATGGATWTAGTNSIDGGGNSGWFFAGSGSGSKSFFGLLY